MDHCTAQSRRNWKGGGLPLLSLHAKVGEKVLLPPPTPFLEWFGQPARQGPVTGWSGRPPENNPPRIFSQLIQECVFCLFISGPLYVPISKEQGNPARVGRPFAKKVLRSQPPSPRQGAGRVFAVWGAPKIMTENKIPSLAGPPPPPRTFHGSKMNQNKKRGPPQF
uniref:Uncharacterized protein n=1 Tax=Sphaerodactylus townsendi TaxID=933632 RepID=A0ACB8FFR8_9SAUR